MAKFEITLTPSYVDSWGLWEGIRELIQNAIDGQTEHNAPMFIELNPKGHLIIENKEVTLPREAMLIGFSSKKNRQDMIGKFGEGLKLGILALCRLGYDVTVYNGSEVWKPEIQRSEKFNSDVLTFNVRENNKPINRLRILIKGVGQEAWEAYKDRFLPVSGLGAHVSTSQGELLKDQRHSGKVYVRGVYVEAMDSEFGFNLKKADVDRDRKMISRYDRNWAISGILNEAARKDEAIFAKLWDMLDSGKDELDGIQYQLCTEDKKKFADTFKAKYGEAAYPVRMLSESQQLDHFGKTGIVVNSKMLNVLGTTFGTFESIQEELSKSVKRLYSWQELSTEERDNLTGAIGLIGSVQSGVSLDIIDVAEFQGEKLFGQYQNGKILLSKAILLDFEELIHTLAHEAAHFFGGDGTAGHVQSMGRILSKVIVKLLNK